MANINYRRVPSSELDTAGSGRSRTERLADKLYAILWILLSVVVSRFTKFWTVLFHPDERVNKSVLHCAFLTFGINTILLAYLIVYLPKIKGLKDSSSSNNSSSNGSKALWDVYCPRVVPTMTAVGLVSALCFVRAVWPVWGFLSPLILGAEFFGVLFASHFLPWF
mmetsp:Transcript_16788/g.24317  ORF Transcript_16788/g.24317 Transcript_16788/m.24317 type:complete len:166 (-) Transcript_16788:436-933(-)